MEEMVLVTVEALADAAWDGVISFHEAEQIEELVATEGSKAVPEHLAEALSRMALWQMPASKTRH